MLGPSSLKTHLPTSSVFFRVGLKLGLIKVHIIAMNDLPGLRIPELVTHLSTFSIAKKYALSTLWLQLIPKLLWNMAIHLTTKDLEMLV